MNDDTKTFLTDALSLAESEDSALVGRSSSTRPIPPEVVMRLKVACMELLIAAIESREFREGEGLSKLREDVTNLFFKKLTTSQEETHTLAKKGLQLIVSHSLLPNAKIYLQTSLRPILSSLGTHRMLNLPLLRGLHRLLEQMSDWFNLTLGEKLLDHLRKWTDPEAFLTGQVSWKAGEEAEVAAAILDLFHLLPRTAVKFLESSGEGKQGLVVLSIQLEDKLAALNTPMPNSRVLWSPYRDPLVRFNFELYALTL